jgi:ferrochelatase
MTSARAGLFDAVVILGFGGPTNPEEIRPFLDRVLRGRPIPKARYDAVLENYMLIGGSSPYNAHTQHQADALAGNLRERGFDMPVEIAYRNVPPFVDDVAKELTQRGARDVFAVVLAPHQSAASWEKYVAGFEDALRNSGSAAPAVEYIGPYFDHPLFVRAHAERLAEALAELGRSSFDSVEVVFTAHSIPVQTPGADVYTSQFRRSAELIAAEAGAPAWSIAYQSRSGMPTDPWLEPDVRDVLRAMPERGVKETIVAPIGFLCDHVEVLYDLDRDARSVAEVAGVRMQRAQSLNDHPLFARMLADFTVEAVERRRTRSE